MIKSEEQKEKGMKKSKQSLRDLDTIKTTMWIMGAPEEKREQDIERLFEELMAENFSNLMKYVNLQIQEAQKIPIG